MCLSPSQLLLATHTQLSSELLVPINNATYVYIVQKRPSPLIPRPCHAHKVDTSPAFQQCYAEEIGYTTPIIFNWVVSLSYIVSKYT